MTDPRGPLRFAMGNRFHTCSNDLSEDKLVNRYGDIIVYCVVCWHVLTGCTGCAVSWPADPNFGSPQTTRLSRAECALAQKRGGGGVPSTFAIFYRLRG